MKKLIPPAYARLLWFSVTLIGVALLVVIATWKPKGSGRITVTTDTNGTARLQGIPLPTTNIRDAAFKAAGAAGIKASLTVTTPTNAAQESNLVETLQSMSRAGLFTTNQRPSPYE